jgi:hypothetical protein
VAHEREEKTTRLKEAAEVDATILFDSFTHI